MVACIAAVVFTIESGIKISGHSRCAQGVWVSFVFGTFQHFLESRVAVIQREEDLQMRSRSRWNFQSYFACIRPDCRRRRRRCSAVRFTRESNCDYLHRVF